MSRFTIVLLALACVTIGHGAQAQSADPGFSCEAGDSQAQRTVTATVARAGGGSVSDLLSTLHDTQVRQGTVAQLVSEAECRALVTAMAGDRLAGRRAVFYQIETSGRQPHVFAAYAALILSDDPGVAETGWDLVYVIDADYDVLLVTLPVSPDAF